MNRRGADSANRRGMHRRSRGWGWLAANGALLLAVMASAAAVVESSHRCRALYAELRQLEAEHRGLREQWGRLLLEQGTWAAHDRVERIAREELGMRVPAPGELRLLVARNPMPGSTAARSPQPRNPMPRQPAPRNPPLQSLQPRNPTQ